MNKISLFSAICIYICIVFASWFLVPSSIRGGLKSIVGLLLFVWVIYSWFAPDEPEYIESS
jgi:hypothetical protein